MGRAYAPWMSEQLQAGNLTLDPSTLTVQINGSCIRLTQQEFHLLAVLARNAGAILPHGFIANQLWAAGGEREKRRLSVLVSRLRTLIEGVEPYSLETVRNRGYGFVLPSSVHLNQEEVWTRPAEGRAGADRIRKELSMPGLTQSEVRSLLNVQGWDPPEPELTEVYYRINALLEALNRLDDLDVHHIEAWTNQPFRGLKERPTGTPLPPRTEPHTDEVAFMTIREQAALIESKQLSPVELTQLYLDRIERYDPYLFAYNLVMREDALREAEAAEAEIAAGHYRGPLHGIPINLKDQFDIKGHPNTGGCNAYFDNIATEDCTIVARLREAGAIILGTVATHEFHMGGTLEFFTKNSPRNPWDLTKHPAGSSSGSGSSVAAGLASGSIGADTGGSIRGPSAVNGITGLRPSWSRLSRQGAFSLSWEMDTAGPLARSAEDTAIILQAIAGYDPKDPTTSRLPVPDYSQALTGDISDLRIGVLAQMMSDGAHPEARARVREAVEVLRGLGATVEEVEIPLIDKMAGVMTAISDGYSCSYHRRKMRERWDLYDYNTRNRVLVGSLVPAGLQTLARRARVLLSETMLDVFETYDVLIGVTGQGPAGPIVTESPVKDEKTAVAAVEGRVSGTSAFSMCGAAGMSIPVGFTEAGLPVGAHLGVRPMDEATVFRVAHAFQQVTSHHQMHPPMTWANALAAVK